jgi:hypothetical protein
MLAAPDEIYEAFALHEDVFLRPPSPVSSPPGEDIAANDF